MVRATMENRHYYCSFNDWIFILRLGNSSRIVSKAKSLFMTFIGVFTFCQPHLRFLVLENISQ
jgi:hypothetical protein